MAIPITYVPDPNKVDGAPVSGGTSGSGAFAPVLVTPDSATETFWNASGVFQYAGPLAGVTALEIPLAATGLGFDLEQLTDCVSIAFTNLVSIPVGSALLISGCPVLTEVSLPKLADAGSGINVSDNASLAALDFPALLSVSVFRASNPLLASVTAPLLASAGEIYIAGTAVSAISLPLLASVGLMEFQNLASLVSLSFPALESYLNSNFANGILITGNDALLSVDFPALTSISGNGRIQIFNNVSLVSINFPALVIQVTANWNFTGNALNQATVDSILLMLLAGGFEGVVDLSGGTNAAPGPDGQVAVAALLLASVNVTTN